MVDAGVKPVSVSALALSAVSLTTMPAVDDDTLTVSPVRRPDSCADPMLTTVVAPVTVAVPPSPTTAVPVVPFSARLAAASVAFSAISCCEERVYAAPP